MADLLPLRPAVPAGRPARKRRRLTPLVADARLLARLLRLGLRTVRRMDSSGELPAPLKIRGRVCWRLSEIRAWLRAGAPDRNRWAAMRAAARKK
jgi:prophage regulatory protein